MDGERPAQYGSALFGVDGTGLPLSAPSWPDALTGAPPPGGAAYDALPALDLPPLPDEAAIRAQLLQDDLFDAPPQPEPEPPSDADTDHADPEGVEARRRARQALAERDAAALRLTRRIPVARGLAPREAEVTRPLGMLAPQGQRARRPQAARPPGRSNTSFALALVVIGLMMLLVAVTFVVEIVTGLRGGS